MTSDAKHTTVRKKRKSKPSRLIESDSSSSSSEDEFIPRKRGVYISSLREKRPKGMLFKRRVS